MSNTCKNCRYWKPICLTHPLVRSAVYSEKRGSCDNVGSENVHETTQQDLEKLKPNDFAVELSGDSYGVDVSLVTGPDFGCVKFEPKEPK